MICRQRRLRYSLIGISSALISFMLCADTDAILTRFDEAAQEIYSVNGRVVLRKQKATLTIVGQYEFDSNIVIIELIKTKPALYLFYCLQADRPSCFMIDVSTRDKTDITVVEQDEQLSNFLTDDSVCSNLIAIDEVPGVRYLSLARNVKDNTCYTHRNAICVLVIDIFNFTIRAHNSPAQGNKKCLLYMASTFVWQILHQYHYHQSVYFVVKQSSSVDINMFKAGFALIQMSLSTCHVVESAFECLRAPAATVAASHVSDDVAMLVLLSAHRHGGTAICTLPFTSVKDYFSNVTDSRGCRSCRTTGRYWSRSYELANQNDSYAEEHAATTLFMSQASPLFSTNAEAVDLAVTRSSDSFVAHILTKDSEITTMKLWNNSQVLSVVSVKSKGDNSISSPLNLVNYNNTLYVCDNQTIQQVDVSRCDRHLTTDACLRDVAGCTWCSNASSNFSADLSTDGQNISLYCAPKLECQTPVRDYTGKPPQVTGISPTWGPKCGGNLLKITGDQLDMARNLSVTIAGKDCRIVRASVVRRAFHCVVPGYDSDVPARADVLVKLDSEPYKYQYQYEEDPSITDTNKQRTITSGGTRINITGDNFNRTWSNLFLVFTDPDAAYATRRFPCDVIPTGVSCMAPPIKTSFSRTLQRMRLSLGATGVLPLSDGLLAIQHVNVEVKPDPVIIDFFVKALSSTDEVVFEGTNLDAVDMSEISVVDIYKPFLFIITRVTATGIHCRMTEDLQSTLFIKVTIGNNLVFYPGMAMQNPKTPSMPSSTSTARVTVQDLQQPETSRGSLAAIISVLCVCAVIAVAAVITVKTVIKRRRIERLSHQRPSIVSYHGSMGVVIGERLASRSLSNASLSDVLLTDGTDDIAKGIIKRLEEESLIIKRGNLTMQKLIGRGNFGSVFKGIVKNEDECMDVAVKTLHQDEPREIDIHLFLKEAYVMKDFKHANVMTLVGICLDLDEMPLVIIPYMEHGDLLTYLHEDKHIPTVKDLVSYGLDIASGMTYLAQLKFVHRDLAARNCMLDSNYTVKVADFGLSRDIYESSYYSARSKGTKLPVKWMAIDSLTNGVFNEKTDVWSYGITLWELMTRGVRPYATVDNWDMERYLNSGRRLPQPLFCPNQLYRVMRKCWAECPDERPTFAELQEWISAMLNRVHHQLGNADKATDIQTTYVNLAMGASYHYENEAVFHND